MSEHCRRHLGDPGGCRVEPDREHRHDGIPFGQRAVAASAGVMAATDVEPETGIRDLTIPRTLMQSFGHTDCGVYAEVVSGGDIAVGDVLRDRSVMA